MHFLLNENTYMLRRRMNDALQRLIQYAVCNGCNEKYICNNECKLEYLYACKYYLFLYIFYLYLY